MSTYQEVRQEVVLAAQAFLIIAAKYNLAVTGFAFGEDPPMIVHFGNVSEEGGALTELHLKLADLVNEKTTDGHVDKVNLHERPN